MNYMKVDLAFMEIDDNSDKKPMIDTVYVLTS